VGICNQGGDGGIGHEEHLGRAIALGRIPQQDGLVAPKAARAGGEASIA
jgi:hypothetical protein